jgi:hypothetical protein
MVKALQSAIKIMEKRELICPLEEMIIKITSDKENVIVDFSPPAGMRGGGNTFTYNSKTSQLLNVKGTR